MNYSTDDDRTDWKAITGHAPMQFTELRRQQEAIAAEREARLYGELVG